MISLPTTSSVAFWGAAGRWNGMILVAAFALLGGCQSSLSQSPPCRFVVQSGEGEPPHDGLAIHVSPALRFYSQAGARVRVSFLNGWHAPLRFELPRAGGRAADIRISGRRKGGDAKVCRAGLGPVGEAPTLRIGPGGSHSEWWDVGCVYSGPGLYVIDVEVVLRPLDEGGAPLPDEDAFSVSGQIETEWPDFHAMVLD